MNPIYILLGSNLGDRSRNLENACTEIEKNIGKIIRRSSVYYTAPWGNTNQPDYYNQAILSDCLFSPQEVLKKTLQIEENMGRVRSMKWEERIIDIDILLYGDRVIAENNLNIPHPMLHLRKFTLVPLAELDPFLFHPVLKKEIRELLTECADKLNVIKI